MPYGIIVPVRNEALLLPQTVAKLLAATKGDRVRIIWVCNGCNDDSATVIRRFAGSQAEIIELELPSKIAALQAGDDCLGNLFPRLYHDADTWLQPGAPARLIQPLLSGEADLVSPGLCFDTAGASHISALIGACWLALPHGRTATFSAVLAVSAAGRGLWDAWPEITGDDIFVSAMVPDNRKKIVAEIVATTSMPKNFAGWVRMRARWLQGEAELKRHGLARPRHPQQHAALLHQMLSPATAIGAFAFAAARIAAGMTRISSMTSMPSAPSVWMPDRVVDEKRS